MFKTATGLLQSVLIKNSFSLSHTLKSSLTLVYSQCIKDSCLTCSLANVFEDQGTSIQTFLTFWVLSAFWQLPVPSGGARPSGCRSGEEGVGKRKGIRENSQGRDGRSKCSSQRWRLQGEHFDYRCCFGWQDKQQARTRTKFYLPEENEIWMRRSDAKADFSFLTFHIV